MLVKQEYTTYGYFLNYFCCGQQIPRKYPLRRDVFDCRIWDFTPGDILHFKKIFLAHVWTVETGWGEHYLIYHMNILLDDQV